MLVVILTMMISMVANYCKNDHDTVIVKTITTTIRKTIATITITITIIILSLTIIY